MAFFIYDITSATDSTGRLRARKYAAPAHYDQAQCEAFARTHIPSSRTTVILDDVDALAPTEWGPAVLGYGFETSGGVHFTATEWGRPI